MRLRLELSLDPKYIALPLDLFRTCGVQSPYLDPGILGNAGVLWSWPSKKMGPRPEAQSPKGIIHSDQRQDNA